MNNEEQKFLVELRRTSASHRNDGCRRTAELLLRAAAKIESLLKRLPETVTAEQGKNDV